jgi:N-methylhydantoinase A
MIRPLDGAGLAEASQVCEELFGELHSQGKLVGDPIAEPALDLRYTGQEHTLTVQPAAADGRIAASPEEVAAAFSDAHERQFGHRLEGPVQIVSVRATLRTELPPIAPGVAASDASQHGSTASVYSFLRGKRLGFQLIDRASLRPGDRFTGPAIVIEPTTATYVDDEFSGQVHESGALLLTDTEDRG